MKKLFLFMVGSIMGTIIALAPQAAYAQGNTWAGESLQQMVEAARWKFGLMRVNAAFTLTNAGYDSDVYYGYLDEPAPDFTLAAGVPVQLFLPVSKKIVLDLSDTPQYLFYFDTARERAWNNVFQGRAHIALERFYIQGGVGLSNVSRRLSPELNVNLRQISNRFDGLVLWQASQATSVAAIMNRTEYYYGDAEFEGIDIGEQLDRREDFLDLVAYFQPNPRIRFFVDGQYGVYTFQETAATARDARSYGVFGGFEFIPREGEAAPSARLQGRLSLGYLRFDLIDPQFTDGTGLAGAVDLSMEVIRHTTVRGFFSRGFQFSAYSGASFYVDTNYGAGISHLFSRRVSVSYDLSIGRTAYPEDSGTGGAPVDILLRYATHTANVNVRLTRNLTMAIFGNVGRRLIGEDGLVRGRNFVGFNLTYGYPPAGMSVPAAGTVR